MEESQVETKLVLYAAEEPLLAAPHGLNEITDRFGDINKYIGADGQLDVHWQADFLERLPLPFPLRLSWDPSRTVNQMTCHRLMTSIFASVFSRIQELGLSSKITNFGGCFAFRPQRTGSKLSAHCWGIAVDLNPQTNPQGSRGDMDAGIIDIFLAVGFEWGGSWAGRIQDPMHFQYCTGY
jgi:hypothetical protein